MRSDIVTIAGKGDQAILVHLAEELEGGVVIGSGKRTKMGNLLLPPQPYLLTVGAVNPLVSRLGNPGADILIGLRE